MLSYRNTLNHANRKKFFTESGFFRTKSSKKNLSRGANIKIFRERKNFLFTCFFGNKHIEYSVQLFYHIHLKTQT